MPISILPILELLIPFRQTSMSEIFVDFYIDAEKFITLSQSKDSEISNLYDIIIASIGYSQLSDSKGTKSWFSETYRGEQESVRVHNEMYYLKVVIFVGLLQSLVLDMYDSLDDFYQGETVSVSQIFADLSEDAGYPISPQYIKDIS